MGLTLRIEQGASEDFPLQIENRDGTPAVNLFEASDVLACQVWAGDGMPVIATPLVTWVDAAAGEYQISFVDTDTLGLAPSMYRIRATATRANQTGSLLPAGSRLQVVDVPGSSVCLDLVTQDFLAGSLAAGGLRLTTEQLEALPGLAKSASRAIRRHCNRYFNRGGPRGVASGTPAFDGLYSVDWPSRQILLRQYPINAPPRVRTNPTVALTVWNTSTTAVQAWVTMTTDGTVEDVDDISPMTTGLTLYSVTNGVTSSTSFLWSTYPTMTALAAAIVNVSGWQATVEDGFGGWPTADFRAGQAAQPALGYQTQVGFSLPSSGRHPVSMYDGADRDFVTLERADERSLDVAVVRDVPQHRARRRRGLWRPARRAGAV